MTPAARRLARILLGTTLLVPALARSVAAADGAFAPPDTAETRRGWAVAERFELRRRFILTLDVANAFSAQNQAAIARAEARIAAIPGVERVIGPARLPGCSAFAAGRITAAPLRARGGGDLAAAQAELARRRAARADATGWFISTDGATSRLLIDTMDPTGVQVPIEAAVAGSGLVLLEGKVDRAPLWPRCASRRRCCGPGAAVSWPPRR